MRRFTALVHIIFVANLTWLNSLPSSSNVTRLDKSRTKLHVKNEMSACLLVLCRIEFIVRHSFHFWFSMMVSNDKQDLQTFVLLFLL